MNKIMQKILFSAPIIVLFILSGCSNYAKFVFESGNMGYYDVASKMTIKKLVDNWENYNVSFSGLSIHQADGIVFDIKKDDNKLVGDYWYAVKDAETFSSLVLWRIKDRVTGKLYRIIGRNGNLFGYIYFPDSHRYSAAKILDDKTIYVYRSSYNKYKGSRY